MMAVLMLVSAFQAVTSAAPLISLWETRNGTVYTVGFVGQLDETHFRQKTLELLSPGDIRVGSVVLYRTKEDWLRARGYGGTGCVYENWRAEFDRRGLTEEPRRCPQVLQAIKLGGDIVLRQFDFTCRWSRRILQGDSDPLKFEVSGVGYEVLDLLIQPISQEQEVAGDRFSPVHLFVLTHGQVTTDRAREVLASVKRVSMTPDITVILRNDHWFLTACDFPILHLFYGSPLVIPSKAEFVKTKQAVCVALDQWPVKCY